jgi:hypothetical protein
MKTFVHAWTRHEAHPGPVVFSARPTIHRAFSGTAEIYRYTGDHPKLAAGALVRFTAPTATAARELMCSISGGVSEAVAKAAGLHALLKYAPIRYWYEDLGGPIGIAEASLRDGSGVFKLVFFRKR